MTAFSEIQKIGKNMYYLNELKKKNNIVPFIGAGVSSCCYPMWEDFLKNFSLTENEKILLEKMLKEREFEEAASYIQTCTGENFFNITVKETFGNHHLKVDNIPTYMGLFPKLANNLIVTTNLDTMIEKVYEINHKNLKVITPDMQDQMNDSIVSQHNYLIKLHGSYEESTKYVLTKEQYNKAYGIDSENNIDFQNPFINILSRLMVSRTFLFLGCSLSNDRTLHVLKQIVSRFNKFVQHYAILELKDDDDENIIRERNLANYGINVIWYPKGEYETIDIIVNELFKDSVVKPKQYDTLPKNTVDFYGRDDEINRIKKKIDNTINKRGNNLFIISLDGMPAIGKTALAINIAHRYKDKYPDAQLYVDCYGYTAGQKPLSDEKILGLLLLAFEIPASMIPDSFEERVVLWQSLLRERHSIIIFDNINSEKQIKKIIPAGSSNTLVLITSRNQLLNIPDVYSIKLDILDEDSAVRLLYKVSGKKGEEYRNLFRQVVRKCEYLPLAIIIIGRRFKDRESKKFIDRFINAPREVTKNISGVDIIYESFDTSYVLLNHDEKNAFKVLGISPCMDMTPNTCAAMLKINEDFAADILDSLYDKRLIIETGDDRYRLHDLMRGFARDKFNNENGLEKKEWIRRLISFYEEGIVISNNFLYPNTISLRLDINIPEKKESDWMKWLGEERINLIACLEYLISIDCEKEYIEFAHLLSSYIRNCFLGDDVLKIAENAVEFSKKNNFYYYLAVSLTDLGLANENIGNFTNAIKLFHQAENIWQNESYEAELAYVFSNEGFTLERLGRYDDALDILQKALVLYQKKDNLFGIGFVKNAMGAVNWRKEEYLEAKKIFEETLKVRNSINDKFGISSTKNNLGFTFLKLGDLQAAFTLFNESINISKEFNDAHGQSVTLNNLGYYYIELKEFNQAIIYALQARETAECVGNKYQIARSYDVAAKANIGLGNYLDAENDLREAMELFKELKVPEYKEVCTIFNSFFNDSNV